MKNLLALVVLVVMLCGCKKLIENEEEKEFPWHFSARINDKDVKYQANDKGSDISNSGWNSIQPLSNDDHIALQGTTFYDPTDMDHNAFSFSVAKFFTHEPTLAEQVAMFHTGSYPFGTTEGTDETSINGVLISYTDSNGKIWDSDNGSQTGSSFQVTEIEDVSTVVGAKNIRAIFNCKLYDMSGNMIPVNNAEFHGKLFYQ